MDPLLRKCNYCEDDLAFLACAHCAIYYCSDQCSAADYESHKFLCYKLSKVGEELATYCDGTGWIPAGPNVSVFKESIIKTDPGREHHPDYWIFLELIITTAYYYSQMRGRPAKARALDIFMKVSKAPISLNRRILNRILPALLIEFGRDTTSGWFAFHDSALRHNEHVRVRKGHVLLAPRLVGQEDEWYHHNDPGLLAMRVLLDIKTLRNFQDIVCANLLESKLPRELVILIQQHLLEPRDWQRLGHVWTDLGNAYSMIKRVRKLRHRMEKNIRKIHADCPYFFPAFFTTQSVMLDLPITQLAGPALFDHGHACDYNDCVGRGTEYMHVTQVAFMDTFRAYDSTPGSIAFLQQLLRSCFNFRSEIEPKVRSLEHFSGDALHTVHADNAERALPL